MTRSKVYWAGLAWLMCVLPACGPRQTSDEKAVKRVLSDYTAALKRADFSAAYGFLSVESRQHISLAEFANTWTQNLASFDIMNYSVPQVSVLRLDQGNYATAIVQRTEFWHETRWRLEKRLNYYLKKESSGWRILRTSELDARWLRKLDEGDTAAAYEIAALCIQINPLSATTPREYVEQTLEKQTAASTVVSFQSSTGKPKKGSAASVTVNVDRVAFDGSSFVVKYILKNVSRAPVSDVTVKAVFKKPGVDEILEEMSDYTVPFTAVLEPGYTKKGEISYYRRDKGTREVSVDLYVSVEDSEWRLVQQNVNISVPRVTDAVKFTVTGTSFEKTMAATLAEYIYTARLDYKITNIGADSLDYLEMRVVWKSPSTGEVVDEDHDYIVWSGGTPLAPGESRSGYVTCGKGSPAGLMARTADVYLARFYEEYELVKSAISIR